MASLMGTYYHNIDAKGRMNFPTKLREILGTTFYVTKGLDQPCLTVCSAAENAEDSSAAVLRSAARR